MMTNPTPSSTATTADPTVPADRRAFETPGHSPGCLLLHGFTGDPREMRTLAEGISKELGCFVSVPLWPGHGRPVQKLYGLRMEDFLQAGRSAVTAVRANHSQVVIVAFSMGAAIAAQLVAESPVAGFIAIAPMIAIRTPLLPLATVACHVVPWVHPLRYVSIDRIGLQEEIQWFDPVPDLDDPETLRRLRNEIRFPLGILHELRRMQSKARDAAHRITSPALVIQGGADGMISPRGARRFYDSLGSKDKEFRLFPLSDHGIVKPYNPHNQDMVQHVTGWLKDRFG